jgi:hypothetical protein
MNGQSDDLSEKDVCLKQGSNNYFRLSNMLLISVRAVFTILKIKTTKDTARIRYSFHYLFTSILTIRGVDNSYIKAYYLSPKYLTTSLITHFLTVQRNSVVVEC